MKKIFSTYLFIAFAAFLLSSCERDMEQTVLVTPRAVPGFTSSASNVVLSAATDANNVVTFKFTAPDYGVRVSQSHTLQFALPSDTTGANAWGKAIEVKLPTDSTQKTFTGKDFNSLLVNQLKLPTGTQSTLAVRIKSEVSQPTGEASTVAPVYSTLTMTVTPYQAVVIYPALLVRGGNSWITPAARTNGFVLTSPNFNSKYEGYLYLPNANGWGGDAFKLESTTNGKIYGWGTSATTLSEGGGNLWLTPAPGYLKVNADLDAMTISYTPVQFYVSGDFNNWSTSATPMTYNQATGKLEANNVTLTAGSKLAFTANGGWDLSYKVDNEGKITFSGPPGWGGNNITVPRSGTFKIVLDLSQGAGKYTYSIE
ncbi:SusE domain-containing protein [Pedobacter sp. SYSU D00535]|uniref:SusE domain-containing protein n=1 Tax=Pedobacter sp. SYSU D00535 TaxID=2810308 RepID=UPI001A977CB9|nr:SusE domain-containing protein [Pedobacter sp. SYSU D00535]